VISLLLEREGWTQLRVQLARLDAPENADRPDG
jgi:hypothetical protein